MKFSGKVFMLPLTRSEKRPLVLYASAQYGCRVMIRTKISPFEDSRWG